MVAHPFVIAVVIGFVILVVGVLSFYPIPNEFNVSVAVTSEEVSVIVATYFQISSVSGTTSGQSTYINWGQVGLAFAPPALVGSFSLQACVGGHCSSISGNQFAPSVPFVNGGTFSATNTVNVGYVTGGPQSISVTLDQNGAQVATGSGSMCVGC